MKNPFHNFNIFIICLMFVFYLDIFYTFMGVYNLGWDHELNPFLKDAIITRNIYYPLSFIFIVTAFFIILKPNWDKAKNSKVHYIYWVLLGWISTFSWLGWLSALI